VPEPGWRFVAADYSQIELRILAHVSGEESLLAPSGREDIHRRTAAEVFGVELAAVTSEQRDVAKTTNFSVIYGVTAFGLSRGLSISPKQAQEFLDRFFERHPKVKAYLERTVAEGRERGFVQTLSAGAATFRSSRAAIRISRASPSAWRPTRRIRARRPI
jgi:DNA polymerase-1